MTPINLNIIRKKLSQAELKMLDKVLLGEKIPSENYYKLYKKITPVFDKNILIDEISFSDNEVKKYLSEIRKLKIPKKILEALGTIYYIAGDYNFNIGEIFITRENFFQHL